MSRIPQSFIDDMLSRLDIVSVVDSRVKLKRTGKNYVACCPFHQEKTPSFTVSPDKQFYYCFGCGASGNALGFVMEYERQGFFDAVESLAKLVGLEVPKEDNPIVRQQEIRRKKLFDMLEQANDFYREQLKHHAKREPAVNYLKNRGLSGHIARDFGLGLAPPGRDHLLIHLGKSEENAQLLIDAGLVILREDDGRKYDRFRNRITFPIRDERGRVIGFGGRVLGDEKPKYLNSPETSVFQKGKELYGLYEARKQRGLDSLIVVEGYMDVIALAQYGIRNAVATLGTACGEEHLKLAFRYVEEVVFCFDGDNAGRSAAKRALMNALSSMNDGRQIKFLFLPEGQDPDSLVRQIGQERFLAQIQHAVPLEEFLFDVAAEGINIHTMDGRARFSKVMAPLLAQIPEGVYQELMFDSLARRTGLSREVLTELQSNDTPKLISEQQTQPEPISEPFTYEHTHENWPEPDANHIPEDYFDQLIEAAPPTRVFKRSAVRLTPARQATIMLLEQPDLAQSAPLLDELPAAEEHDDEDYKRLMDIASYLRKRPNSSFNAVMGFWGGSKGLDAQKALAELMATHLWQTVKGSFDPTLELESALRKLHTERQRQEKQFALKTLRSKGLSNLSPEERQQLIDLTRN